MAEHRIRKNNIIYIIPNDELFEKWKNDEAFIDEYGRLMNRRPHRVLKELKHYVEKPPTLQQRPISSSFANIRNNPSIVDYIKETARDRAMEASEIIIDRAFDAFFYEVVPNVWHEHIVPLCHRAKEALTAKELTVDSVLQKGRTDDIAVVKPKVESKMTQQEADTEKRKVLYHWVGMLSSLKKLHDAGEIDVDVTLAQLTDPAMLNRVNSLLSENPNLLEVDKYILLHGLLGRELYEEERLVPIRVTEITKIAESYGYKEKAEKMEDNHNG